jgi:hypothetical protein
MNRIVPGVAAAIGLFCASALALTAQAPPQAAPGTVAISGVVIDAASRAPIAEAVVSLSALAQGEYRRPQLTDEKGRFVFADLPARPDGYTLSASAYGYLGGRYGRVSGQRIRLRAGEWFSGAHVEMFRPASISGRITDEYGDPLVGVQVRSLVEVTVAGATHLANGPGATTDDRGVYRLMRLSPGKYIVSVPSVTMSAHAAALAPPAAPLAGRGDAPGVEPSAEIDATLRLMLGRYPMPRPAADGRLQVYEPLFYPGVSLVGDARSIEVTHGQDQQSVDVQLRPVPAVRVAGRLVGPPEAVSGFTVRLLAPGMEHAGNGAETATTLSGPDGVFVFPAVPAGRYTLDVRKAFSQIVTASSPFLPEPPPPAGLRYSAPSPPVTAGTEGLWLRHTTTPGDSGLPFWGRASLAIDRAPVEDITVAMQRGVTISGRAVFESAPQGLARTPWAGVDPADGDITNGLPPGLFMMQRNDQLSFAVHGLRPGKYYLRFIGNMAIKSVVWNGRDVTYRPFDTSEGRDFTDVIVTFTDQRAQLGGGVRDAQGQPAPGAVVIAFPVERDQWINSGVSPPRLQSAPAGSDSSFRLQLPAGDYFVVALDPDRSEGWQNSRFLEAASALASRVTLGWGESQTLDVRIADVRVR